MPPQVTPADGGSKQLFSDEELCGALLDYFHIDAAAALSDSRPADSKYRLDKQRPQPKQPKQVLT